MTAAQHAAQLALVRASLLTCPPKPSGPFVSHTGRR